MHPLEILNKLHKLKTSKTRKTFLEKLPPDDEFWFGASQALSISNVCYPLILPDYVDPKVYGSGAPRGIFEKMLTAFKNNEADAAKTSLVMQKFGNRCTEEEWKKWYKPILSGDLIMPISVKDFYEIAPKPYRFYAIEKVQWEDLKFRNIEDIHRFHPAYVEPMLESPRVFIFTGQRVIAFTKDGQRVEHPVLKKLETLRDKTHVELVFDAYLESEEIITIRDVISSADMFDGRTSVPYAQRLNIIEGLVRLMNESGIIGAEVIEIYSQEDGLRENTQMFLEQGYKGFVFVDQIEKFLNPVIAHPTKKSVFTCLDIISGKDAYDGKAEYILARGTINKARVETKVFYGLNWEQRDTYFKSKDELIGKRFEILSCGITEDGKVIMPIFKQWRK